jgi:hypothetical protein
LQSKDDASAGRMPHFKSQFAKRSYRGSQDLRASEKSQGNEGMVWTPVRVVNPNVMSIDKQKLDQTGVEVQPSGVSNEVVIQNPVKNRRAEMERYVPDEGLSDNKEHFSQSISVGQIEIGQIKIGSFEEYEGFQRQSAQQIPSNSKGDAHQQEGQSLSAKNPQGHSQPFSNQKPQEFYQPKAGSASGDNEKHETSHSTASRSGSSWTGDHRTNHQYRDRDHNSERRGQRYCGCCLDSKVSVLQISSSISEKYID